MLSSIYKNNITRSLITQLPKSRGIITRLLNVHEYIGIDTMDSYGIKVPKGYMVETIDDAMNIYKNELGGGDVVIKAQVLAGGRGLGHFENGFKGGVHLCTNENKVQDVVSNMLGNKLITKQTGEKGILCQKVYLVERLYMRREMYFSIMMDRSTSGPLIIASPAGGTSIEDVAETNPELIFKEKVDIETGITDEQATNLSSSLGFENGTPGHDKVKDLIRNIYTMFIEKDLTLLEINPLAETPEGEVVVCDAKLNFDDNSEFRQKDMFALRDYTQEDPREVEASEYDLNYIGLDGNIGCLVNGAGLAMATMDIIKLKGGSPANFLDVGGGATEAQVQKAFELLNHDTNVRAILVNIFGGIMRCDVIAQGIIQAASSISMGKPIVIRLQGTNVEEARKLLEASGFRMIICDDMEDAAEKAVGIANIVDEAAKVNVDVKFDMPNFLPL